MGVCGYRDKSICRIKEKSVWISLHRFSRCKNDLFCYNDNTKPKEEIQMQNIQNIGKINTKVLEAEFGKIRTDEIVITDERLEHIMERHPEDYNLFQEYAIESVNNPDIIIKDGKNKGTIFMIKSLPDTNLNVVVRVVLETDGDKLKNSVMTFYRIREKNLKKLIERNKVLYKKE